jgi:protein-tyrosine phosphatase
MSNIEQKMRDSMNNPLRIDTITAPGMPGLIGMTICPGKKGPSLHGGLWNRDLKADMEFIRQTWRADVMVTLLEKHEFKMLGIEAMQEFSSEKIKPMQWIHLEITDGGIPDERFEQPWLQVRAQLISALANGERVLVHCRGGLGRTGLVVAKLLIETGVSPDEAIKSVRTARKGAIETEEQENYVRNIRPDFN